jgi:hypothetical protein
VEENMTEKDNYKKIIKNDINLVNQSLLAVDKIKPIVEEQLNQFKFIQNAMQPLIEEQQKREKLAASMSKALSNAIPNYISFASVKPLIDEQLKEYDLIQKSIKPIIDEQKKNQELISSLSSSISNLIPEISMQLNVFKGLSSLLSNIDFSKISEDEKKFTIIFLKNGFYPGYYINFRNLPDPENLDYNSDISEKIAKEVENNLDSYHHKLLKYFDKYKTEIEESFTLYESHNYRLCILSLINNASIIFNDYFVNIDFGECTEINKKLKSKQILEENDYNYIIFIPYITNQNRDDYNMLLASYRYETEKYKPIPYNRNSIIHGYDKNFGTKINCLRWFTLLFHAYDLINFCEKFHSDVEMEER